MLPTFHQAMATEHQKDLLCEAARYRRAALVPQLSMRFRLGRRLVTLGTRISGDA